MRALLVAFFFLSIGFSYSADQIGQPPKPDQKSATEQRGTESFPIIVKSASPTTESERAHEHYEKNTKPWNETALAWATIALSGITLVLAVFTGFLWCATTRLIASAEKTAQRQLRAYVGIAYPEIKIDSTGKRIALIEYINTGQTPAKQVDIRMSASVFKEKSPKWTEPGTSDDDGKGGVLLPGVTWTKNCKIEWSEETSAEQLTGENRSRWIVVSGTISYLDIFDRRSDIQFRFWSGDRVRQRQLGEGRDGESIPLISDIAHTKAEYGEKA